jgi:small subunit ribosomal protein S1
VVPRAELDAACVIGHIILVYLEESARPNALPKASVNKANELLELRNLSNLVQAHREVQGFVAASIKGGFSVALLVNSLFETEKGLGLRAFLPMSQATLGREAPLLSDREPYFFSVKEFDQKTGNIIVSLRDHLLKTKRGQEKLFWESAKKDQIVSGVVQSLLNYGAFINVSGVDGLLHVSDMAWEKQPKILNQIHVGQKLKVKILELDKKARKLKLGLKQLTPDPWQSTRDQFQPGKDVEGDIVALADFGAFVQLADGIEGLIHLSEISWQRIKHPSQRFQIGDKVKARILSLDLENHRISLSLKALEQNPIEKLAEKFPVGAVLKTVIASIRDYGVFVELGENILGLVHIGELSWTNKVEHPSELLEEGQSVEIVVLGFDSERQRVSCSIKRTQPDPWSVWQKKYAKGTRHEVIVKRIVNQGAECELEPELIGYCPTRDLSTIQEISRPQDIVKVGATLRVEVTHCDPSEHRLNLSVRIRAEKETKEEYQMYLQRQAKESSARVTLKEAIEDSKPKESV